MKRILFIILLTHYMLSGFGQQFDISADYRARMEYRNGYGTLKPDSLDAAGFITQRARLSFDYRNKNLRLKFSPQVVKVWGEVPTTSKNDLNNGFHEAFGEIYLNSHFTVKAGRQEINYDDARIFGNVDWLMQARSHDALLIIFNPDSNNTLHAGFALNANKETNFKENYTVSQYKAFQYLWYHGAFKSITLSFLLLNNGMPYLENGKEKVAYSQTIGPRIIYTKNKLTATLAGYFQSGNIDTSKVNAMYLAADILYKINNSFKTTIGFEFLSGKDDDDLSSDKKSFNPLYGTNHKFNGYMDYFYVGNHLNDVGLIDAYATVAFDKNKFGLKFTPHYFNAAASIYKGSEKQDEHLGTEIDLTLSYKIFDYAKLEAGYSQMFATESMEVIKNESNSASTNNWAYVTLFINPSLFSHKVQ